MITNRAVFLMVVAVFLGTHMSLPAQAQGGVIHACANNKKSGQLRLVASPEDCKKSETALTWSVQGRQGEQGEPGPIGLTGSQGEQGQQGEPGGQGEQGEAGLAGQQGGQGVQGDPGESSLVELIDANDTVLGVLIPRETHPFVPGRDFWLYNRVAELFFWASINRRRRIPTHKNAA